MLKRTNVLAVNVTATNPETGLSVHFSPGMVAPAWAEEFITNPKCWVWAEEDEPEEEPEPGPKHPTGPYAALTVADLREECDDRGLPTAGNKHDLIARLEADDAAD